MGAGGVPAPRALGPRCPPRCPPEEGRGDVEAAIRRGGHLRLAHGQHLLLLQEPARVGGKAGGEPASQELQRQDPMPVGRDPPAAAGRRTPPPPAASQRPRPPCSGAAPSAHRGPAPTAGSRSRRRGGRRRSPGLPRGVGCGRGARSWETRPDALQRPPAGLCARVPGAGARAGAHSVPRHSWRRPAAPSSARSRTEVRPRPGVEGAPVCSGRRALVGLSVLGQRWRARR